MKEKLFLTSKPLEISEFKSYLEATFLISVLDEYNLNGILIPEDVGKLYHNTIIGQPIVAALKYNIFGEAIDFKGHEVTKKKDENGNEICVFNTLAIGSIIDSWIEEREVDGYEGLKKCIMIKTKLWNYRYPTFYKVFMKLWKRNNIKSSWEILISDSEQTDTGRKVNAFEFIGNCLLGTNVQGAVTGAGSISVAECQNDNKELTEALCADIKSIELSENKGGLLDMANENENKVIMSEADIQERITKCVEEAEIKIKNEYEVKITQLQSQLTEEKEKSSKINEELSTKLNEIATIGEAMAKKDEEIENLKPYKSQIEKIEKDKKEEEDINKRKNLSEKATKSGLISAEELENNEDLKNAIDKLDEHAINAEISKRLIEKVSQENKDVETSEEKTDNVKIDLNASEESTIKVETKNQMELIAQYCC